MTTIIKNGKLITAAEMFDADIRIEGEHIQEIGTGLPVPPGAQVVDAAGKLVLPGGVDAHVHFDLPMGVTVASDDHYTGSKAAAFGGTTTVIDFIPHDPGTLEENVTRWRAKADPRIAVDYSSHINITRVDAAVEEEFAFLARAGITSVKVFMAYPSMRLKDGDILRVMRAAAKHGILTLLHAENGDVIDILVAEALAQGLTTPEYHALTRPSWGAVEAGLRGAALAAQAGGALYIVHMNAGGEVDMLQYARSRGLNVMGETCPQYLFFSINDLRRPDGAKWVCSPPVRSKADNLRLWQGLQDGIIQTLATDHCPFFYDGTNPIEYEGQQVAIPGKELGREDFTRIPNGLPGVGDRLPVMWTYGVGTGRISPNRFVELACTNPAKIFGLYPQKGSLLPGADADIAIWDPLCEVTYGVKTARHRTDYNLYEGFHLVGYPEKVFLRGSLIVDGETWLGRPGGGNFLKRKPFQMV